MSKNFDWIIVINNLFWNSSYDIFWNTIVCCTRYIPCGFLLFLKTLEFMCSPCFFPVRVSPVWSKLFTNDFPQQYNHLVLDLLHLFKSILWGILVIFKLPIVTHKLPIVRGNLVSRRAAGSVKYAYVMARSHWNSSKNLPARSENFMKQDEEGLKRAILTFTQFEVSALRLQIVCTALAQRLERKDVMFNVVCSPFLTSFNTSCSV